MLRILGRTPKSTNMVTRSESKIEDFDVLDDLSSWEFVNPSDDEQEDSYSFSDQTDDDEIDAKEEDPCEIGSPVSDISMDGSNSDQTDDDNDEIDEKEEDPCEIGSPVSAIYMEPPSSQVQITGPLIVYDVGVVDYSNYYHGNDDYDEEEEEDEDDYDDDEYDLDDELVPKWLSDKLGRQRIRKMGKRASSRMKKSKKGPSVFNRPGCVHGKHGLGVQHNYV